MIDIGANLLHPQFDADRAAVIEQGPNRRVWTRMLVTATDLCDGRGGHQALPRR